MSNGSNRRTPPAPPSLASGQHPLSLAATKFYWRIRCSHPTMDSTPLTQLLATTNRSLGTPFSFLEPTNMAILDGTLDPIRTKLEFSIQSVSFDQPCKYPTKFNSRTTLCAQRWWSPSGSTTAAAMMLSLTPKTPLKHGALTVPRTPQTQNAVNIHLLKLLNILTLFPSDLL